MDEILKKYIPKNALPEVLLLLKKHQVYLQIVNQRVTRHGDYRKLPNGQHKITVNANLNTYKFLITLIHEIAHLVAFTKYGTRIKPHGKEWKLTFQQLMLAFINPNIFPNELLPILASHFKNPKASSDTDTRLALALKQYDPASDKLHIFEIPFGARFKIRNNREFIRGNKRVKRYECKEIATGKIYLFNPNAEVDLI
jgi:hypothetical protein